MIKAYFVSGLGADGRIFQRIKLPSQFVPVYIDWIEPAKNETLGEYALRLSHIIQKEEDFILIGLSFGGMLCTEINKFIRPIKTFLISSAVNEKELSKFSLALGKTGIYKMIPDKLLRSGNSFIGKRIGLQSKEDKTLANAMASSISANFFKGALYQIIHWKNNFTPSNLIRIHGTIDKIIPFPKSENVIPVEDGTHFMVYNRADEINAILQRELSKIVS